MRELTGRYRLKRKWFGLFQLEVEIKGYDVCPETLDRGPEYLTWTKATPEDIYNLKIFVV